MTYEIEESYAFECDVDDVLTYLIDQLKAPRAASQLLDELKNAFECLQENPFLHAVSRRPILHMYGCREYLVKNYVIVYKVEGSLVSLLGFYHQRQLYELRFLDRGVYPRVVKPKEE